MSYFLVELCDEKTSLDEENNSLSLNMDDYLEFVQTAKDLGILENILKQIDFGCTKCKSFTVPAVAFYEAVIDRIDLDFIYHIIHGLTEKVYLTEEEWIKYSNYGQKSVDVIGDASLVEVAGELYRFVADEVFFRFDDTCECNSMAGNTPEE